MRMGCSAAVPSATTETPRRSQSGTQLRPAPPDRTERCPTPVRIHCCNGYRCRIGRGDKPLRSGVPHRRHADDPSADRLPNGLGNDRCPPIELLCAVGDLRRIELPVAQRGGDHVHAERLHPLQGSCVGILLKVALACDILRLRQHVGCPGSSTNELPWGNGGEEREHRRAVEILRFRLAWSNGGDAIVLQRIPFCQHSQPCKRGSPTPAEACIEQPQQHPLARPAPAVQLRDGEHLSCQRAAP
jgi:hypothetical protein